MSPFQHDPHSEPSGARPAFTTTRAHHRRATLADLELTADNAGFDLAIVGSSHADVVTLLEHEHQGLAIAIAHLEPIA